MTAWYSVRIYDLYLNIGLNWHLSALLSSSSGSTCFEAAVENFDNILCAKSGVKMKSRARAGSNKLKGQTVKR